MTASHEPTLPLGAAREREHGQILVLFAFVLISLLLISALAVDYGGWLLARRSYQNAADQAAIAGAYLLTTDITASCSASISSKNVCARQAAWESLKTQLGLISLDPTSQAATSTGQGNPYPESGYRIWVDSPPSDAGTDYTGFASSEKTIYVRVERDLSANLSRIITPSTRVGAWATAGRIPKSFAIVLLCRTSCHGSADDLKVNGGSTLILSNGDIGSNSYVTTNGTGSYVALGSNSSAFMAQPSNCTTSSVSCQLVAYDGTNVNTAIRYSGQALPQVVDPGYFVPISGASAVPWQCNGTGTAFASLLEAGPVIADANGQFQPQLDSAVQPPTPAPVTLGLASTVSGQIQSTAAAGGPTKLNGITVTLTNGATTFSGTTSGGGANAGKYSIAGVTYVAGGTTYSTTVVDTAGVYHQLAGSVNVNAASITYQPSMDKNPVISGTVRDSALSPISGATVHVTLGASDWTAVSAANGSYSVVAQVPAGGGPWTLSTYATATGYTADSPYSVTGSLNATTSNQNHTLSANPGTINGTVTSGGSPVAGATVTWSLGGTPATTDAFGNYSITSAVSGTGVVTASKTGYSTGTSNQTLPAGGTLNNVNISLTQAGAISGTVTDNATGLAVPGQTVSVYDSTGVTLQGSGTTNASGFYTVSGLTPIAANPNGYTVKVSVTGYTPAQLTKVGVNNGATTTGQNFALVNPNCGTGGSKGSWTCSATCGTLTNSPANCSGPNCGTAATVGCSKYDASNAIRPGTYQDITISSGCAWIDPLGGPTGMASGQAAGVVHVKGTFQIQQGAFLFGDGVTIVLDSGASMDFKKNSGFVLNYEDDSDTFNGSKFRTGSYIGGGAGSWIGGVSGVSYCSGDSNSFANYQRGAAFAKSAVLSTWTGSGTSWCYTDTDSSSVSPASLGLTWYLRGADTSPGGNRFDSSSDFGFLFNGILYGPQDDIGLNGSPSQAAAGQIVAYTLTYGGGTDIYQSYNGIPIDGPPYLIEPYAGEPGT